MEKYLITKQMLAKYDKNNDRLAISTLIFAFAFVITFCAFSKGFKVEMNIKTFGISLLVGAALWAFTWIILKILKKEPRYNYHLVEDVLLSKSTKVKIKSDYPFFSDNRTPGLKNVYVLNFLHSGVFQLPNKEYNNYYFKDSTIYDFAQREDRFYVLVDSNNIIKEIFDIRLFDISTDDFELIENKYYPKKR
ncbi:MAG: hypothetical protein E7521_06880 [Ruminococcaceae bacterium]|nr:hypothetical protein [Oscillospiraceae bacterium]